jgi:hypothetical protein
LDCTLVDRVHSIRQYALRFAEDFRQGLVPVSRERLAEVLIAADGWGYRPWGVLTFREDKRTRQSYTDPAQTPL